MASVNRFIGVGTIAGMYGILDHNTISWGRPIPKAISDQAVQERTSAFVLRMEDAYTDKSGQIRQNHEDICVIVPQSAAAMILGNWRENDIVAVDGNLSSIREDIGFGKIQAHVIVRAGKKIQHIHRAANPPPHKENHANE